MHAHAPCRGLNYCNVCASVKSSYLLSGAKMCPLFGVGPSVTIGKLVGAKARCLLDRGACYLVCPL